MALSTRQKWGIGGIVTAVGLGIVSGFAIAGKLGPEIVYVLASLATVVLGYFGISSTLPPKPPE